MNIRTEIAAPPPGTEIYPNDVRQIVRDTIYRATLLLDDEKWEEWLALCDEGFLYDIKAWSPEINRDMTYLHATRDDLGNLIRLLPKHNTDHSPLTRHTSVYSVEMAEDGVSATAVSSFVIFQHLLDGTNSHIDSGESRLFLVGKYYDTLRIENGVARFLTREVRLANRRLEGFPLAAVSGRRHCGHRIDREAS